MINSKTPDKNQLDNSGQLDLKETAGIIQFKIVYWGPGESGKTTNFLRLSEKFNSIKLTNGYSIDTTDGRTLWQDTIFLSFKFDLKGSVYSIIAQVVTCTGQERFLSTREYVLDGADGIVFVGDSDPEKMEENKRSFRELVGFVGPKKIPYIVQLNKRDLKNAVTIKDFKKQLGLPLQEKYEDNSLVVYPTVALQGENVVRCYQDLLIQIIFNYFNF